MDRIDLGSFCILLEDLDFVHRKTQSIYDDIIDMTYHYHVVDPLYSKIFADISQVWVIEVCLVPEELHLDLWKQKTTGLFIIENDLSINLCDPKSILAVTKYVQRAIKIANASN